MKLYHISINSFYVEIVRVKFQNDEYIKAHIRYWSKSSMTPFSETKNQKILKSVMKHWEVAFI